VPSSRPPPRPPGRVCARVCARVRPCVGGAERGSTRTCGACGVPRPTPSAGARPRAHAARVRRRGGGGARFRRVSAEVGYPVFWNLDLQGELSYYNGVSRKSFIDNYIAHAPVRLDLLARQGCRAASLSVSAFVVAPLPKWDIPLLVATATLHHTTLGQRIREREARVKENRGRMRSGRDRPTPTGSAVHRGTSPLMVQAHLLSH